MLAWLWMAQVLPAFGQQQVNVQVFYDSFGQECSWQIINKLTNAVVLSGGPGTSNSYNYNQTASFQPGEYQFQAFDSEEDGWNQGGWYAVTPTSGISTGVISFSDGASQYTDFAVFSSNATEVGIVSWVSPVSGPGLTSSQIVTVKVRNYGTNSISNFSLSYSINGGFTSVSETYPGILVPGNVLTYSFSQTANMGSTGQYACIATVTLGGDAYAANNSISRTVTHVASIANFPWTENFNSFPPSQWTLSGNYNWAGYQSSAAYCNFFAWENAEASLITPPINLNQATNLNFGWSSYLNEYSLTDQLTVQISLDNQASWTTIWEKQGNELFTNDGSTLLAPGSYISESIDLSSYINNQVYIKFIGSNTSYSCNLFMDYVNVTANAANDLQIVGLAAPAQAGCELEANEIVQAIIKNRGSTSLSNFTLSYTLNGGTPVNEVFPYTLNPGQEYTYYFNTPANFYTPGTYTLQVAASVSGDANLSNNTYSYSIKHLAPISTFPFSEDFDAGFSNYFYIDTNLYSTGSIVTTGTNSMIALEGGSLNLNPVWIGGSSTTTSAQAWQINTLHLSTLSACQIDASTLSSLELLFDLKQYYKSGPAYSWFRLVVNGNPVADVNNVTDFNPVTSSADDFEQLHYDLSSYIGSLITIEFQAANKYNHSFLPGNVAYIDNILLREIPPPDLEVIDIISPSSGCYSSDSQVVTVQIGNPGGTAFNNFQVTYSINGFSLTEIVMETIEPGDTLLYSFTAGVNLLANSTISVEISVQDSNAANDSIAELIQVYPLPALSLTGLDSSICIYEQPVTISATPSGGTFTGNGMGNQIFTASDAGFGIHEITYTYIDPTNNCSNTISQEVTVNGELVSFSGFTPAPDSIAVYLRVYYNSFYYYQQSWEILNESGQVVIPVGTGGSVNGYSYNDTIYLAPGTYTFVAHDNAGNGWNNSWYWVIPSIGTETGKVFYTVPNGQTIYSQSTTFVVGENPTYCGSDSPILLTGTPLGGQFSGTGIQGNYFYPGIAGAGNHTVTYTYQGQDCLGTSAQDVTILTANIANLGPDVTICSQLSTQLSVLNPGTGSTILWNTGSTANQISVTQSGNYSITLTSSNGCQDVDTVTVTFSQNPQFSFGPSVTACANNPVVLAAGFTADTYLWSTGETTSSITVTNAGSYGLTVSLNGCSASDLISVNYESPDLQIQDPQSYCVGDSLTIQAGAGFASYSWSNASTNSSLTVNGPGMYAVTVTDSNGCSASQSITVTENALPEINLGPDQELIDLAIINIGNSYASILWSDNTSSPIHAFDPNMLGIGVHTFWVQVSNASGCTQRDTIVFTVSQLYVDQDIDLPSGWSIFSLYVTPSALNIATILQSIQANIIIVKNGSGNVYWPSNNLNAIGNVVTGQGYQIFMAQTATLSVNGALIQPENNPLSLPLNWSLLGYIRTSPAPISQMMSSISSNIVIVKDGNGQVYWPSFSYNGIGNMNPGQGYQIKTSNIVSLVYPSNTTSFQKEELSVAVPVWYEKPAASEQSMTLGIPRESWNVQPAIHSELGVFNSAGEIVGSAVYLGEFTAIHVNGKGAYNSIGLSPGESYQIKLISPDGSLEQEITGIEFTSGDGIYQESDIEVIREVKIESNALQSRIYPNPVAHTLMVSFNLEDKCDVKFEIYDSSNRLIILENRSMLSAGENQVSLAVENLASGTYFLKIYQAKISEVHTFVKSKMK